MRGLVMVVMLVGVLGCKDDPTCRSAIARRWFVTGIDPDKAENRDEFAKELQRCRDDNHTAEELRCMTDATTRDAWKSCLAGRRAQAEKSAPTCAQVVENRNRVKGEQHDAAGIQAMVSKCQLNQLTAYIRTCLAKATDAAAYDACVENIVDDQGLPMRDQVP